MYPWAPCWTNNSNRLLYTMTPKSTLTIACSATLGKSDQMNNTMTTNKQHGRSTFVHERYLIIYTSVFPHLGKYESPIDEYWTKLAVRWIHESNQPIHRISHWIVYLQSVVCQWINTTICSSNVGSYNIQLKPPKWAIFLRHSRSSRWNLPKSWPMLSGSTSCSRNYI